MNKCLFIICWFGKLPDYFEVWLKSVEFNGDFDFLILTDDIYSGKLPKNVFLKEYTLFDFSKNARKILGKNINIKRPYRICDFRPMFGLLFKDYIKDYDFWGYCDLDLIFGKLSDFITNDILNSNDALFNAGHLTLIRNSEETNCLFMLRGGCFSYRTVVKRDAIFAFDECTGIQRIARKNNLKAHYGLNFIDADTKYRQLTSRSAKNNPKNQAYYWEEGNLYRCKAENNEVFYQKIAYIHMQKRKINKFNISKDSFWICPEGYIDKSYIGKPLINDLLKTNPYDGEVSRNFMVRKYKVRKIKELLSRSLFQIFVRVKQEMVGINNSDSSITNEKWYRY
ncbi:hypothetical protein GPZ88_08180 [Streptococcus ruminicola]|uniref:Uncharacterized protein n=1 Tax=Streptococcus ruminicola TaxID=2686210 RepID=A0A6G8I1M8_9STRE|nr:MULTISPECIES: DUF6625 family protein [Streptococcus]QIM47010.1 hypothetical protein GPZ88_08180 [Streptococcus ruminicola]SEK39015.1 hypothetical protein SAMN05216373_0394 [Streptococcus equinus]